MFLTTRSRLRVIPFYSFANSINAFWNSTWYSMLVKVIVSFCNNDYYCLFINWKLVYPHMNTIISLLLLTRFGVYFMNAKASFCEQFCLWFYVKDIKSDTTLGYRSLCYSVSLNTFRTYVLRSYVVKYRKL